MLQLWQERRWNENHKTETALCCCVSPSFLPNKYWEMTKTVLYTGLISGCFCLSYSSLEVKQNTRAQLPAALQIFLTEKKNPKVLPLSRCNTHLIYRTVLNIYNISASRKDRLWFSWDLFQIPFCGEFAKRDQRNKKIFLLSKNAGVVQKWRQIRHYQYQLWGTLSVLQTHSNIKC